tara:strand:+ start:264 stop:473 length:210 start_codon:yes stop_codon:yes gene_type:complete
MKGAIAGDLIYVPSEVLLYKGLSDAEAPSEWKKVSQPINLLVISVNGTTYEVFYDEDYWLVKQQEVYKT